MPEQSPQPRLSLIIPTRERAGYLAHSVRTCVENPEPDLEILILDNASQDNTFEVVHELDDKRIRYVRNKTRLSMRDNFERGIELSQGDILCFLGDDDAVFPFTVNRVLELFATHSVDAVSAARAHYFWPDMLSARRSTALIPRGQGLLVKGSKATLRHLLNHRDYYRLPCLYHGFVRRSVVERIKEGQGRFFMSSQVDMFSAIALSMENLLIPAIFWVVPRYGAVGAARIWLALNAGYVLIAIQFMHRRLIPQEKWRWYISDVLLPMAGAFSVTFLAQRFQPSAYQDRLHWFVFLLITGVLSLAVSTALAGRIRQRLLSGMGRSLSWRYN